MFGREESRSGQYVLLVDQGTSPFGWRPAAAHVGQDGREDFVATAVAQDPAGPYDETYVT